MKIIKSIGWIILVQAGIIGLIFGLLYALKAGGISGGVLTQAMPFVVILGVTAILVKVRKRSLAEIGFSVTRGGILLAVLFLALAAAPIFAGPVTVRTEDPLLWNIGYFALVGFTEEVFFRGYIKTQFGEANPWIWRVVSAFAFAALHFISAEELTVMLFVLLILYGVVFALLRDLLGSVVPLIAFHAAWDLFGCYSENYGNVLWMFGAWAVMIGAAAWYARRRAKGSGKERRVVSTQG